MNQVATTICYKSVALKLTWPNIPIVNCYASGRRKVSRRTPCSLNRALHLACNPPTCPNYPPRFVRTFSKYRSSSAINSYINEGRGGNKIWVIPNVSPLIHNLLNMTAITTNKLSSHSIKIHPVLCTPAFKPKLISVRVKRKIRSHK